MPLCCLSVDSVAAFVMYMETPLEDTNDVTDASKPESRSAGHQLSSVSKSTGIKWRCPGTPRPTASSRCRIHSWGPGRSISNISMRSDTSGCRGANVSSPAPRRTYWPIPSSTNKSSTNRVRATMAAR